ncbi:MAG: serpin family protein, partial [Candidatus Omnitrophota bacterium]
LKNILSEMGMPTSFSPSADFSAITGKKELFISDVIHQAYVKVDEKGTEAAGATGVVIKVTGVFTKKKIFKADHPFIFIIQEKNTGNILFVGKIFKPA